MKKFLMMTTLMLVSAAGWCQQKKMENPTTNPTGRWLIYWASYTEWGHGPDCHGWGLCQYQDCWFCDVDDKYKAQVIFDDKTRWGEMLIALDPKDPNSKKAIEAQAPFTVSDNIENRNSTLYKGIYKFDATVGTNGGYRLKIYVKNK